MAKQQKSTKLKQLILEMVPKEFLKELQKN